MFIGEGKGRKNQAENDDIFVFDRPIFWRLIVKVPFSRYDVSLVSLILFGAVLFLVVQASTPDVLLV